MKHETTRPHLPVDALAREYEKKEAMYDVLGDTITDTMRRNISNLIITKIAKANADKKQEKDE